MKNPKPDRHSPTQFNPKTILLATDRQSSILAELESINLGRVRYSAYGQRSAEVNPITSMAFNGEFREPDTGWYLLGNGYRAYNPVLMRFHSPDSLSPFGKGGLNPYAYCVGDPVNHFDPTGHFILPLRVLMGGAMLGAAAVSLVAGMTLPKAKQRDIAMGFAYGFTALAVAVPLGMTGYSRYVRPRLQAARAHAHQSQIPPALQRVYRAQLGTRGALAPPTPRQSIDAGRSSSPISPLPSPASSRVPSHGGNNPLYRYRRSSSSEGFDFSTPEGSISSNSGSVGTPSTLPHETLYRRNSIRGSKPAV